MCECRGLTASTGVLCGSITLADDGLTRPVAHVRRRSSGSSVESDTLVLELTATTVTTDSPASKPRLTCSGSQALSSSFSPKQNVYLPGKPWVERSTSPAAPP